MIETVFYNARIIQPGQTTHRATALLVRNGRIAVLGVDDDVFAASGSAAQRVNLGGKTVVPGFNDAHIHVWKVGHLLTSLLDLRRVRSLVELEQTLRERCASLGDGEWLCGRGWNEARLAEGVMPSRRHLDAMCPDRPAHLVRTCAHITVANSHALKLAGIDASTPDPPGGAIDRDADGNPTGILRETAQGLLSRHTPRPGVDDFEAMIVAAQRQLLSLGITSASDPAVLPDQIEAYRKLDCASDLRLRMNLIAIRCPDGSDQVLPLPEKIHTNNLRLDSIKLFADGGLSGATAALSRYYRHSNSRGIQRLTEERLYELTRPAHKAGYRVATHAIGDAAIEVVLNVYEGLAGECSGRRHRIEHFGLPTPSHITRTARGRFLVVTQPAFVHEMAPNFRRYLDDDYLASTYPFRSMMEAGIDVAFSTDAPVVEAINPLIGIGAAMTRRDSAGELLSPGEEIGFVDALAAYTRGGAIASGDQDNRGSLSVGEWADFAVLAGDPESVQPNELGEIRVEETWVGGQRVFPSE